MTTTNRNVAVRLTEEAVIGLDALQQLLDAAGPNRIECQGVHVLMRPWLQLLSSAHDEMIKPPDAA